MSRVIVIEFVTLDGVMQDPDGSEGFGPGGWAFRFGPEAVTGDPFRLGEVLHPATTATTITVAAGKGGDVMVTDGPYAEAKEILGGFYVIEAADLDEATRWAARIPTAWRGKVELRPVAAVFKPGGTGG
jgi:hypothetical protein